MKEAYRQTWIHAFDWKRRIGKSIYLKGMLMHILLAWIPILIIVMLEIDNMVCLFFLIFFDMSLIPMLSCSVQRLHDVGKSGWWLLLYIAISTLVVGNILFLVEVTNKSDGDNKWGRGEEDKKMIPESMEHGFSEEKTFVDEYVTTQELADTRKKLIRNVIFIALIVIGLLVLFELPKMILYGWTVEDIWYDYLY